MSTSGPASSMIGARMKTACTGVSPSTGTASSASNESSWRPKAFRSTTTSEERQDRLLAPGDLPGQHDHPGAGAEYRGA